MIPLWASHESSTALALISSWMRQASLLHLAQQLPQCLIAQMNGLLPTERVVQVPTFRADPLTPSCDTWCEFPVSDRPNAVMQFLKAAKADPTMIKVCTGRLPILL